MFSYRITFVNGSAIVAAASGIIKKVSAQPARYHPAEGDIVLEPDKLKVDDKMEYYVQATGRINTFGFVVTSVDEVEGV